MKRFFKKALALLLTVIMLVGVAPLGIIDLKPDASAKTIADCSVGDTITFGSYPQSKVTDSQLVSTLTNNNPVNSSWVSFGYYVATEYGNDEVVVQSDYMKYKDVTYNGVKYRGIYFTAYRPISLGFPALVSPNFTNQKYSGYYINKAYWFKYEPLIWRVLDPSEGFVMCNAIIDEQVYQNFAYSYKEERYNSKSYNTYSSDWPTSTLREWLNNDFYNTAFNDSEKSIIATSHIENKSPDDSKYNCSDTNDKIFLLSNWDVINPSYGFNSSRNTTDTARQLKPTDYAKVQGSLVDKDERYYGNSWWRLRSPDGSLGSIYVDSSGSTDFYYHRTVSTGETQVGVVPALKFNQNPTIPETSSSTVTTEKQLNDGTSKADNESLSNATVNHSENVSDNQQAETNEADSASNKIYVIVITLSAIILLAVTIAVVIKKRKKQ